MGRSLIHAKPKIHTISSRMPEDSLTPKKASQLMAIQVTSKPIKHSRLHPNNTIPNGPENNREEVKQQRISKQDFFLPRYSSDVLELQEI